MPTRKVAKPRTTRKKAADPLFVPIRKEIEAAKKKLAAEKKKSGMSADLRRRLLRLKVAHRALGLGKLANVFEH